MGGDSMVGSRVGWMVFFISNWNLEYIMAFFLFRKIKDLDIGDI